MNHDDEPAESKIIPLGVNFRKPLDADRYLVYQKDHKCQHGQYLIDEAKAEVECGKCHEKMSPMHVLREMRNHESDWHALFNHYQELSKKLSERERVKCSHCGKLTKVNWN